MAKIRRATFFFPALETNTVQVNSGAGNTNEITNFRVWITDFPLVFDPILTVIRPPESFEELVELQKLPQNTPLDANGTPNRTGRYSSSQYFIGVALNGIVIHDGVFKKVDGITAEFVTDSQGSNPNSPTKQRGVVKIDTGKLDFGVLDLVQIVVIKSNTYSPWLYYGRIPERASLANKDNRFIASQGAIFPLDESEIIQAAGMRYFIDVFKSQIGNSTTLGTLTFAPIFYGATDVNSSTSDVFFMGDILDGDSTLGYRSFTTFKVLEVQENLEFGFNEVQGLTIQRADAYKSIDSRLLEYQKNTYKIKQPISLTNYYFITDTEEKIIPYYKIVSSGFNLISEFIDFTTTGMSVDLQTPTNDSVKIASQFEELKTFPMTIGSSISKAQQMISNDSGTNKKVCVIFSDLISEIDGDDSVKKQFKDSVSQFISSTVGGLKLVLIITDLSKKAAVVQLANETFGKSNVLITESQDISSLGFLHFVGVLMKTAGTSVAENNLIEIENGININTIKQNVKRITQPSGISLGIDYDNDGIISLIDLRHYELTTKYKPTASQNLLTTFLGDAGTEMRFWRKLSPIGQLYNIVGTIESTEFKSGGNLLLTVKIKWLGPEEEEPQNNIIKILVEYGARTNLGDLSGEIEFQGRMFLPSYMIKTKMNNIINFNKTSDISSWFRVFTNTAQQIIDFGKTNTDEPLLIIRSNVGSSSGQGGISISPIFSSPTATQPLTSTMSVVSGPEEVADYLNFYGNDSRILLNEEVPALKDDPINLYNSGSVDVVFSRIEFEIVVPAEEKPPSSDNDDEEGLIGDFEYELQYKAKGAQQINGQDVYNVLDKFYSVIVFDGNNVVENNVEKKVFKLTISPSATKSLLCKPTDADSALDQNNEDKNKSFNITYNYIKNNEKKDYVWTWNSSEWSFVIKKNNKILSSGDFEIQPDSTSGSFKLKKKLNMQEDILVAEFKNISANQPSLKIGSKLRLKAISGPNVAPPKFRNLKINFTTENSIERVECSYSSTLQGDSFYLTTPANGFVSLSGYGWSFETEQKTGNSASGLLDSTRIIGNLTGPTLYFDAFSDSIEEKTISKSTLDPRFFPTADVVFSNAVNTLGIPFMEILAILFDLPPPQDVERFASTRSKTTDRLTLVYNTDNFLQQKYSFTNFIDYNTDDGWDFMKTSLRKTIPLYSETFSSSNMNFSISGGEITIDVTNPELAAEQGNNANQSVGADKILVAVSLKKTPTSENSNTEATTDQTVSYELFGSVDGSVYDKLGYDDGSGETTSLIITVKNLKDAYFQIPDITLKGYTKIKLKLTDPSFSLSFDEIFGHFVSSYVIGRSPAIFETNFGEYVLFFVKDLQNINQKQLVSLVSLQDCQTWQRPATLPTLEVETTDSDGNLTTSIQPNTDFEKPVIILTGYSGPVLLKSKITDSFYIFVFNSRVLPGTIEMVEMNRALYLKLNEDNSNKASDIEVEISDESQTSLVNEDDVVSYARVFKANENGSFNHLKTVLKKATNNYTVELLETGDLYCALLDSSGQFRIKYNRSSGGGFINTSFNWDDLGIDLLDATTDNGDGTKGSYFGKIVNNSNMGALTLKYSPIEDILWLFVSTNNNAALNPGRLFLMKLPESIIRPFNQKTNANDNEKHTFEGEELTDIELDKKFQIMFNKIKPTLVSGKKEGLNPEFVEINSNNTVDDFPSQIIAVEWLSNGDGQIYFVSENNIKSRLTRSSGIHWQDNNGV